MNEQSTKILLAKRLTLSGRVQGVGFRPFVYRHALQHNLQGWVRNESGTVIIHIEGDSREVQDFTDSLTVNAPPLADPCLQGILTVVPQHCEAFDILASCQSQKSDVHIPPDLFICDDCLKEMEDKTERRHDYPFTNCTQCGPRYTIIEAMPYDRPNTSLKNFPLCNDCCREYENPLDRRFHAQPLACPACGPTLSYHRANTDSDAKQISNEALELAVRSMRNGEIVAIKGVGGYHLMVDATNNTAVERLRFKKQRPDKPLAVMFPLSGSDGLDHVRAATNPAPAETKALLDPARPIVMINKKQHSDLSAAIAPGLGELGVFLPYSPLHHLLLKNFGGPVVATSGNISGEPVLTNESDAKNKLAPIADCFLHHNRPIVRPADDSVVRIIDKKPRAIRLGRGTAPLELTLPTRLDRPILAVGGHMKVSVALGFGDRVVISPHIGDLDSPRAQDVFEKVIKDMQRLYDVRAKEIICDLHPGYASTRWARKQGLPIRQIQHHRAHASALAGEYRLTKSWLTFAWDGVGYGDDGTLWGGEAFLGSPGSWQRVASIEPFTPPGGTRAGLEPWRSAAALMWASGQDYTIKGLELATARIAFDKKLNAPVTSSVGRLFDAAAALVLGIHNVSFEGQGPMQLEAFAQTSHSSVPVPLPLKKDAAGVLRSDWQPLLSMLCEQSRPTATRASDFHESLAKTLVDQVKYINESHVFEAVGLCGGVFQNRLLSQRVIALLEEIGIPAHLPQQVPANDGGLAFGQIIETLFARNAT